MTAPDPLNLLNRIRKFEAQRSALEPDAPVRDSLTGKVTAYTHAFTDDIGQLNGYYPGKDTDVFAIGGTQTGIDEILAQFDRYVVRQGISPASAGHLGYIPGGGIYTSALGDYLAAVSNEYAGVQFAGPGATAIENACIDWLKKLFGFPTESVGNLSSGGSIANLIALTAARDKKEIRGPIIAKSVIYMSRQTHHCIHKALRITGLGEAIWREIEPDRMHRLSPAQLERYIQDDLAQGLNPFLVVANAGTTDTGSVDPMAAIEKLCADYQLWFHVDAAYGGFFILCDEVRHLFKGIELADSLVVDPHKGLFMPYGIGTVLVKDPEAVMISNHYLANYMQDAMRDSNPLQSADLSPELTKHFRGMRMWPPLILHGVQPFAACLSEKLLLTQYFRNLLQNSGFEIGPEPELSVSYFWWPHPEQCDAYNEELLSEIHRDGRVFLSSTRIGGRFVIRMAILAFRTGRRTVEEALEMIMGCKAIVDEKF